LERIGFYGVQANLIMYLTGSLGMSTASAAAGVNAWAGTVQVLPLVGALAADSRLGRYRAVLAAAGLYLLVSIVTVVRFPLKVVHLSNFRIQYGGVHAIWVYPKACICKLNTPKCTIS
jgi:dipeptide/tripeptide permease